MAKIGEIILCECGCAKKFKKKFARHSLATNKCRAKRRKLYLEKFAIKHVKKLLNKEATNQCKEINA